MQKCAKCHYLCLLHISHDTNMEHECMGGHNCEEFCYFCSEDSEGKQVGFNRIGCNKVTIIPVIIVG